VTGSRRASCARTLFGVVLAIAVSLLHCGRPPESKVAADLKTIRQAEAPDKLFEQGKAYEAISDFVRAEQYYSAALEQGAAPERVIARLLRVCMLDGRFRLAAQYAKEHIRRHPLDAETRLVYGTVLAGLGEVAAAEVELRRVLVEKPSMAQTYFVLGQTVLPKDPRAAREMFAKYVQYAPNGEHAEEARSLSLTPPPAPAAPPSAPIATAEVQAPPAPAVREVDAGARDAGQDGGRNKPKEVAFVGQDR
jgi:tetratricopeptide (TPR) repeat protein